MAEVGATAAVGVAPAGRVTREEAAHSIRGSQHNWRTCISHPTTWCCRHTRSGKGGEEATPAGGAETEDLVHAAAVQEEVHRVMEAAIKVMGAAC